MVGGNISQRCCEALAEAALSVPDGGVILDLNCGEGRSTLSMAFALDSVERDEVSILAVDNHVTNAKSSTPHEDGTILKFLQNLRFYKSLHRVVPMVMSVSKVSQILNRKCANMVVVQVVTNDLTQVSQDIETAKFALRAKGTIVVCLSNPDKMLWNGLRRVLPENSYTLTYDSQELRIYESGKKGG